MNKARIVHSSPNHMALAGILGHLKFKFFKFYVHALSSFALKDALRHQLLSSYHNSSAVQQVPIYYWVNRKSFPVGARPRWSNPQPSARQSGGFSPMSELIIAYSTVAEVLFLAAEVRINGDFKSRISSGYRWWVIDYYTHSYQYDRCMTVLLW